MTQSTPARVERRELKRRKATFDREMKKRRREIDAKFDAAHAKADARRDEVFALLRSRGLTPGDPDA